MTIRNPDGSKLTPEQHTEYVRLQQQAYQKLHRTSLNTSRRAWSVLNPEKQAAAKKREYLKHKRRYSASAKNYHAKNRSKINADAKVYADAHKKEAAARFKLKRETIPLCTFRYYRTNTKAAGREFSLTLEYFEQLMSKPYSCHYCGIPMTAIGLDRVDNSIGYVATNVVTCCKPCNFMKRDMDHDAFIAMCSRIARNHGKA